MVKTPSLNGTFDEPFAPRHRTSQGGVGYGHTQNSSSARLAVSIVLAVVKQRKNEPMWVFSPSALAVSVGSLGVSTLHTTDLVPLPSWA